MPSSWNVGPRLRARAPSLLALGALAAYVVENRRPHFQIDDAFITYRFAMNLADGHGLVYNVGERVEGFTSLLWTLFVALFANLGVEPVVASHWLGVASGAAALWLTYLYARAGLAEGDALWAAISPWLLLATPAFAMWSVSGLETALFVAAAGATLVAEARGRLVIAALTVALATLVRPEGALLAATTFGFLFWKHRDGRRRILLLGALYGVFLGGLTAFRLAYFGAPVPNTFYAKVGQTEWWGFFDVGRFFLQLLLPALAGMAFSVRDRRRAFGLLWFSVVPIYVAAVGGDVFPLSRFFLPIMPVVCALVVQGCRIATAGTSFTARFASTSAATCLIWYAFGPITGLAAAAVAGLSAAFLRKPRMLSAVVLGASLLFIPISNRLYTRLDHSPNPMLVLLGTRQQELTAHRTAAEFMHAMTERTAESLNQRIVQARAQQLVASPAIGVLGYYCRAPILDLLGLVDPVIARTATDSSSHALAHMPGHQRSNVAYVLSKKPKYVLIPRRGTELMFPLPAVLDLWASPEFKSQYRWDSSLQGYVRKASKKKKKKKARG